MPSPAAPTIASLHDAYRRGTPVAAVIADVYARIAAVGDPGIFIHLRPRRSCGGGRAPARLRPGAPSALGHPVAVKDNIDVAGLPTTAACPAFSSCPSARPRPSRSSSRAAPSSSARPISTSSPPALSCPLALSGAAQRLRSGPRAGRIEFGSAVAVAQGIVPIALGTDTAGSGRVPAGLNDLVGLKPSVGAISTRGVLPACRTLDCVSVFAHDIADAFLAYGVMRGFDAEDAFSRPSSPTRRTRPRCRPHRPAARGRPPVLRRCRHGERL